MLVIGSPPPNCPRPLCEFGSVDPPWSPLTLPLLLRRPLSSVAQNCTREPRSLIFLKRAGVVQCSCRPFGDACRALRQVADK